MNTTNETDIDFITLRAVTRNVIEYLSQKQKNEERQNDRKRERRDEQRPDDEREYIEHRLREIRAWERRINGNRKPDGG